MSTKSDLASAIIEATKRLQPHILKTPLYKKDPTSSTFYKAENLQYTGSFKLRGATSKLTKLIEDEISTVITASTGNHGLAVATIGAKLGMNVEIFVPETIPKFKQQKLEHYPIQLHKVPGSSEKSEIKARQVSDARNIPFISPYNDYDIIAGQGSIATELEQQVDLDQIRHIYITVGGGGLISGIGSYLNSKYNHIEIIGCQPTNSPAMYQAFQEGKVVDIDHKPTLSDGSAGGLEKNSITFDLAQNVIDRFILISEEEIREAMRLAFTHHNMIIEGAAAVAHAAAKSDNEREGNAIVVWCGGNIDSKTWLNIVSR